MTLDTSGNNVSQGGHAAKPLKSVAEARAIMLAGVVRLAPEQVPLEAALGRVLADRVIAGRDQPPFDVSSMDGYAIRSADAPGRLELGGESAAGRGFAGACQARMAIRISTGAAVPAGADAIVIQEDVRREGEMVEVPAAKPGQHMRPRGGDFRAGQLLLDAGRRLDGLGLSLAAAAGLSAVPVVKKPRIAILSSGDELAAPGTKPGPWQIFDSATFGLQGWIESWGGAAHRLAVEKDDVLAIARAAEEALKVCDLLLVVGGASVGDHDHARPALQRLGLSFLVDKVGLRPGKPTWFGKTEQAPVLGLPGNPASALVCARLFLRPLLEKMLGCDPEASIATRSARLVTPLPANGPREHYLRAHLDSDDEGRLRVRAFEDQDSSLLSVFAAANALIRLPPLAPPMPQEALVDVLPLDGL